ncbi:MAG: hypothetical protein R3E83_23665 [Burkholderiaceae bacterium]
MNPITTATPLSVARWQANQFGAVCHSYLHVLDALTELTDLNLQTTKVVVEETGHWMGSWLRADPGGRIRMQLDELTPASLKAQAYCGHVQRIFEQSGTKLAKLFDKQIDMSGQQMLETVEAMAADGPVGYQSLVSLITPAQEDTNASADASPDPQA